MRGSKSDRLIYCTYQCLKWRVSKIVFIKKFIIHISLHKQFFFFSSLYKDTYGQVTDNRQLKGRNTVVLLMWMRKSPNSLAFQFCNSRRCTNKSVGNHVRKQIHFPAMCFWKIAYNDTGSQRSILETQLIVARWYSTRFQLLVAIWGKYTTPKRLISGRITLWKKKKSSGDGRFLSPLRCIQLYIAKKKEKTAMVL